MELTDDNVIEYNEKILPLLKDTEPLYSIVPRVRNHDIKGGDNIEVDIYLTGLGIPDKGKIVLILSSPNIIDDSCPGISKSCIKLSQENLNGKDMIVPVCGKKYVEEHELDPNGFTFHLVKSYFLPLPNLPAPDTQQIHMPEVMAEKQSDGYDPISISLKTLEKAKAGDYEINVILTYTYQNIIKQASDKVKFHITNWWDRNGARVITVGTISTFILLVLTFLKIWGFIGS